MEREQAQNPESYHFSAKSDQKTNIFDDLAKPITDEGETNGILREKDIIGQIKSVKTDILNISDEAVDSGMGSISSIAEESLLHKRKMPKPRINPSPRKVDQLILYPGGYYII